MFDTTTLYELAAAALVADAVSLVVSADVAVGDPAYSEKSRSASDAVFSVRSLAEMSE